MNREFGTQTLAGYTAHDMTTKFRSPPAGKDDRRLTDPARLIGIKEGKVTVLSPWYKVPRLIPEEMLKQGLLKDKTVNINYLPAK